LHVIFAMFASVGCTSKAAKPCKVVRHLSRSGASSNVLKCERSHGL